MDITATTASAKVGQEVVVVRSLDGHVVARVARCLVMIAIGRGEAQLAYHVVSLLHVD